METCNSLMGLVVFFSACLFKIHFFNLYKCVGLKESVCVKDCAFLLNGSRFFVFMVD